MTLAAKLMVLVGGDTAEAEKALADLSGKINGFGDKLVNVGQALTLAVSTPLAGLVAKSVSLAAEYDKSMGVMKAATKASGKDMERLDNLAMTLGNDLKIPGKSAMDAAEAMAELGKNGLSVNDIMTAAQGTLLLSSAGLLTNAGAAEVTSQAIGLFALKGEEAMRVADLLAAAATRGGVGIEDMAEAFMTSAPAFGSAKIPIEDLFTALSEMAKAGVKGSAAGTDLKKMLETLQAPGDKAKKTMEELGISVYDFKGQLKPVEQVIAEFTTRLGDLTTEQKNEALATIFGKDQLVAIQAVLGGGLDKWQDAQTAIEKEGEAARIAGDLNGGLAGAFQDLKQASEDAMIEIGKAVEGPLTDLVRKVGEAATAFGNLSEGQKTAVIDIGLGLVALGPGMMILGSLIKAGRGMYAAFVPIPGIITGISTALATAGIGIGALAGSLATLVLPIAAVGGAIKAAFDLNKTVESGIENVSKAWTDFFAVQAASGKPAIAVLQEYTVKSEQAKEMMRGLGLGGWLISDAEKIKITSGSMYELNTALAKTSKSYEEYLLVVKQGPPELTAFSKAGWSAAQGLNEICKVSDYTSTALADMNAATSTTTQNLTDVANESTAVTSSMTAGGEAISWYAQRHLELAESAATAKMGLESVTTTTSAGIPGLMYMSPVIEQISANLKQMGVDLSETAKYYDPGDYVPYFTHLVQQAGAAKRELDLLITTQENLTKAMDNWLANTAGQVANMLGQNFTESSKKYRDALLELDGVMGTNYTKQLDTKLAVKDLVDQYTRTSDLDKFKDGLQKIKDEGLKDMQTQLEAVTTKAQALYTKLLALPSEIKIKVSFIESGIPGWVMNPIVSSTSNGNDIEEIYNGKRAGGGPVIANRPYVVGERGPEMFVPPQSGTIVPNEALGRPLEIETVNIYSQAQDGRALFEEFRLALEAEVRSRRYAGEEYVGV